MLAVEKGRTLKEKFIELGTFMVFYLVLWVVIVNLVCVSIWSSFWGLFTFGISGKILLYAIWTAAFSVVLSTPSFFLLFLGNPKDDFHSYFLLGGLIGGVVGTLSGLTAIWWEIELFHAPIGLAFWVAIVGFLFATVVGEAKRNR